MLLAIDTSTRYAGVALADQGKVLVSRSWFSLVNHTAELLPAVAETLRSRGLSVADLDGIAVALGPGGFSALRVGVSVAKGLAMTAGKPLLGVGTLLMEAYPYLNSGWPVCALLDAGRGEVAAAHFGQDRAVDGEEQIQSPQELLVTIREPTIICGEGTVGLEDRIRSELAGLAVLVSPYSPAQRLWSLGQMGQARLDAGESDDVITLQPNYLRMPSIGVPKRRDWVPQRS